MGRGFGSGKIDHQNSRDCTKITLILFEALRSVGSELLHLSFLVVYHAVTVGFLALIASSKLRPFSNLQYLKR